MIIKINSLKIAKEQGDNFYYGIIKFIHSDCVIWAPLWVIVFFLINIFFYFLTEIIVFVKNIIYIMYKNIYREEYVFDDGDLILKVQF